jgi:hypothetical protein
VCSGIEAPEIFERLTKKSPIGTAIPTGQHTAGAMSKTSYIVTWYPGRREEVFYGKFENVRNT